MRKKVMYHSFVSGTKADPGPPEQASRTSGSDLLQVSGLGRVWSGKQRREWLTSQGDRSSRCIVAHARQAAVESRARDGLES